MRIDELLRIAQQGIARKEKLKSMIKNLEFDRNFFAGYARSMQEQLKKENLDVQKLEHMSLKKAVYAIFNVLVERTEKEKAEALKAKLKCDAAKKNVDDIDGQLKACQDELAQYEGIQQRYDNLYEQKKALVMSTSPDMAQKVMEKTTAANAAANMVKEIDDAIRVGKAVLPLLRDAEDLRDSAQTWSLLHGRKGLITGLIKEQYLDELQEAMWNTSRHIRYFNKELADIGIQSDIHLEPIYFDAESFYEWIFWQSSERAKLRDSQSRMAHAESALLRALSSLEELRLKMQARADKAKAYIDAVVLDND